VKLQSLDYSRTIFQQNYLDLIHHWSQPEHGEALSVERNRHKLQAFQEVLSRLLFNYVSSAMALVEHTRNIYRSLNSAERTLPGFEAKMKAIGANPTAAFVKGLRVYSFHFRSLPVSTQFRFTQPNTFTITHGLNKQSLLEFEEWPAAALAFLSRADDLIDLRSTLQDYHALVGVFQGWFGEQERIIFAAELGRVDRVQRRYLAQLVRFEVNSFLAAAPEEQAIQLPSLLMHAVLPKDWAEVNGLPLDSSERTEKLLIALKRGTGVNDEWERKIRSCFEGQRE
jgi:hypothetical protein